jgi:hypothetical protein
MSSRLRSLSFPCLVVFAAVSGCSSSSSSTPNMVAMDGGTDPATCNKPPAKGYTQVVPSSGMQNVDVGVHSAMALSKDGYPVIAYYVNDSTALIATLYAVRWDPCAGAWATPLKVDSGLQYAGSAPTRDISMALDPVDGRIGIAYLKTYIIKTPNSTNAAFVALSTDGGKTFGAGTKVSIHGVETTSEAGDIEEADDPQIALGGGKTYVAYNQTSTACGPASGGGLPPCEAAIVLATGSATGTAFTQEFMKDGLDSTYGGYARAMTSAPIGLALDSAGVPGLVAHVAPATGDNTKLMFFRPGATGTLIMDSANKQNDRASATLTFDGTSPRVLTRLNAGMNDNNGLLFLSSTDGKTWSAPLALPLDADVLNPKTQALLTDGKGGVVALAQSGDSKGTAFPGPKFWRSTDLKTFTIGSAGAAGDTAPHGAYMSGALTKAGKIQMAFYGDAPEKDSAGVVYWSEP